MNRRDAETQKKEIPKYVRRIMPDTKPFENITKPQSTDGSKYRCPCCNHCTLDERGGYDICQVCFWEDDGQDDQDANEIRGGPNGTLSLTQARQNFQLFKAADKRFIPNVRPPRQDEIYSSAPLHLCGKNETKTCD